VEVIMILIDAITGRILEKKCFHDENLRVTRMLRTLVNTILMRRTTSLKMIEAECYRDGE